MNPNIKVKESYDLGGATLHSGVFNSVNSSASKKYLVSGASTEEEAVAAAYAFAPEKTGDNEGRGYLPRLKASVQERCGDDVWKVLVEYGYNTENSPSNEDNDDDDVPSVCFQCTTSTQRVVQPISQKCVFARQGVPEISDDDAQIIPIGWNGKFQSDSMASGVDIPVGMLQEQYTVIMKYSSIRSIAWRRKVLDCMTHVNKNKFMGWEPGEAMLIDCSYATPQRGVKKVKVTFTFLIRKNENNAKVQGKSIGKVKGHQYVWTILDDIISGTNIVKSVKYIFTSDVLYEADFSVLGI